ncbi:hypothetical protein QQA43_32650 (plasmid) [Mycolicibacterium vanbaalenii]|uniref:hypothetical protein n=1 Tax=Mycolicibacterium vanbaalenii TaxID=110539 RepID=UPI002877D7EA|nr:hypothetical protein [Mycolicibacterium vanbaalenii]WND60320.1 hypothetical protein QQA43_32650 [Mycolicibacterium vanbaalenii]
MAANLHAGVGDAPCRVGVGGDLVADEEEGCLGAAGRWMQVRMPRRTVIAVAVVALVALEVRQQSSVALLTAPWTGG